MGSKKRHVCTMRACHRSEISFACLTMCSHAKEIILHALNLYGSTNVSRLEFTTGGNYRCNRTEVRYSHMLHSEFSILYSNF